MTKINSIFSGFLKTILYVGVFLVVGFLFFGNAQSASAGTCSSTGSTAWATGSTWTGTCAGASGIPAAGDTVTILNTHNVTIATGVSGVAGAVTVDSGGTLTITSTGTLAMSGNLLVSGTGIISGTGALNLTGSATTLDGAGTISLTGATTITNNKTINAGNTLTWAGGTTGTLVISTGTTTNTAGSVLTISSTTTGALTATGVFTNNATVTMSGTTANVTLTGAGTFTNSTNATLNYAGGTPTTTTFTTSASGNTVNYNATGAQTCKVQTYINLTLGGGNTKTCLAVTITNMLVTGSTIWDPSTADPTISGTLDVNAGSSYDVKNNTLVVTGTTTIGGTITVSSTTGTKTFGNVVVNTGGAFTFSVNEPVAMNGNLQVDGTGAITSGTAAWTFSKSGGGGTISGTASAITITAATFTTTYTNSIATLTITTVTITSTTLSNSGTLALTNAVAGTSPAITNTGTLNLNMTSTTGLTTLTANTAGTVNYGFGGTQTLFNTTYYNLTLSNSGAKTMTSITTTQNFTMSGSASTTGNVLTTISGNVDLSGTSIMTTGANLTVTGTVTVGTGAKLSLGGFTFGANSTTSVTGTIDTVTVATGTKTFSGLVTVNSGGSFSLVAFDPVNVFGAGITNDSSTAVNLGLGGSTLTDNLAGTGTGGITFEGTLAIAGGTTTNNNNSGGTVTVTGVLSGASSSFIQNHASAKLSLGATPTITTLTASLSGNLVTYTGGTMKASSNNYYDLTIAGVVVGIGDTVANNLIVSSGSLTLSNATAFTVTGTTTVSGGTLALPVAANIKLFKGLVTVNGGTLSGASTTVVFEGGITQSSGTVSLTGTATFQTNSQTLAGTQSITTITNNVTNASGLIFSGSGVTVTTLTQGTSAVLIFSGTVPTITTLTATANPNTVQYIGGTQTVKGTVYHHLTINASGVKTLGGDTTANATVTITLGTLDTDVSNNRALTATSLVINGGTFLPRASTITLTGTDTVFNYTSGTYTAGTETVKLTDSSSTGKTFAGGGQTFNNLWIAAGAGAGSYNISGNNIFADFKDDGTVAHSILFTAASTQTVATFTVNGTVGQLISIDSTTTGTHALVSTGANISVNYLNIQHSVASGTGTWSAGANSIDNNSVETAGSGWIFATAPTVTTQAVSSITTTTATGNGDVTSDGGSTVTERGIAWNTTTAPTKANFFATTAGTTGVYTSSITSLTSGTLYYVRAYAINAIGTTYGNEVSFTTLIIPTVTTPTVTLITSSGATLGANVTSLGIPATISARGTCWGTSPAPVTDCTAEGLTTTGIFTHARTGMSAGTFYYYRGYATNTTGTAYSADGTFTTLAAPTVTTQAVSSIATTTATGNGDVTSDGGSAITERGIAWNTSTLPTTANFFATTAGTTGAYTSSLTSLTAGTLYYVRAYAINAVDTTYGNEVSFTTLAVPTLTTPTHTSISETTATLGANVTSLGIPASISARGVVYGASPSPTGNATVASGTTTGVYTTGVTALTCNTLYYYRGYAINTTGTAYSADDSFTTSACSTTTLGNGTDPGNSTIGPDVAATDIDKFSLVTSSGTDNITALTVTLAPANSFNNLSKVEIIHDGTLADECTDIDNPSSVTLNFTGCSLAADIDGEIFRIRITPKTHANMPAVPGASYAITARVTAITATNATAGTDSGSATITVDNASPAGVTSSTATAGNTVVNLAWTNPADDDFATGGTVVVLRRITSAVDDVPVEGTIYTVGNAIGTAIVACVVTGSPPATSCSDTGLTNGSVYHHKIFTQDSRGNYNVGTVPSGSPATPNATTTLGNGTNPGSVTIAPSAPVTDLNNFSIQTNSGTDDITGLTVTFATGTAASLSLVEITTTGDVDVCTDVANPGTDAVTFTGCTISATTVLTDYKVRITPKTHANMPVPPGLNYSVTGTVTSFTGTNTQLGTDSGSATITVDNLSPANVNGASAIPDDAQVALDWTNPVDSDFSNVLILKNTVSITDVPIEGSSPSVNDGIGSSTVIYSGTGISLIDSGLTNGTTYYYKIFSKDTNGNYSVGTQLSATPSLDPTTIISTGTDPASSSVAESSTNVYLDQFRFRTNIDADSVPDLVVTTTGTINIVSIKIMSDDLATQYFGTVTTPAGNDWSFSGGASIPVSITIAPFRILIDVKSRADLGQGSFPITGKVSSFTSANPNIKSGLDSAGTTITIDLEPPQNVSATSGTALNVSVSLAWTNPVNDFNSVVILRGTADVTDSPVQGASYSVGNTIGSAIVACVTSSTSCLDSLLTNDIAYFYKIFTKDNFNNYSNGIVPTGSPFTPTFVATTTLADGDTLSGSEVGPETGIVDLDAFSLVTDLDTDFITALTVSLSSGTYAGISEIRITSDDGSTLYFIAVSNPSSNTVNFSGGTPIPVTTSATQFKVRIIPKTHANMPVPPGVAYAVTGTVTSFTSTNAQSGSDSASATITIDNASPENVTSSSGTAGDAQVTLNWTNPSSDFSNAVILRDTATIGSASIPSEGSSPEVDSLCSGTACTVRYISNGTSFIDTSLTNGTEYFYRIFTKDTAGNYSATGVEVNATPTEPTPTPTPTPSGGGGGGYVAPIPLPSPTPVVTPPVVPTPIEVSEEKLNIKPPLIPEKVAEEKPQVTTIPPITPTPIFEKPIETSTPQTYLLSRNIKDTTQEVVKIIAGSFNNFREIFISFGQRAGKELAQQTKTVIQNLGKGINTTFRSTEQVINFIALGTEKVLDGISREVSVVFKPTNQAISFVTKGTKNTFDTTFALIDKANRNIGRSVKNTPEKVITIAQKSVTIVAEEIYRAKEQLTKGTKTITDTTHKSTEEVLNTITFAARDNLLTVKNGTQLAFNAISKFISNSQFTYNLKPKEPVALAEENFIFNSGELELVGTQDQSVQVVTGFKFKIKIKPTKPAKDITDTFKYTEGADGVWSADAQMPIIAGKFALRANINYEDGDSKEMSTLVLLDPEGYIYEQTSRGELRVSNAKVSLWQREGDTWVLWPAEKYGQSNPQTTDSTGQYAFLAPEGEYYIEASAENYSSFKDQSFELGKVNPINVKIELKYKGLPF